MASSGADRNVGEEGPSSNSSSGIFDSSSVSNNSLNMTNPDGYEICTGPVSRGEKAYLLKYGFAMENSIGELYGEPSTIVDWEEEEEASPQSPLNPNASSEDIAGKLKSGWDSKHLPEEIMTEKLPLMDLNAGNMLDTSSISMKDSNDDDEEAHSIVKVVKAIDTGAETKTQAVDNSPIHFGTLKSNNINGDLAQEVDVEIGLTGLKLEDISEVLLSPGFSEAAITPGKHDVKVDKCVENAISKDSPIVGYIKTESPLTSCLTPIAVSRETGKGLELESDSLTESTVEAQGNNASPKDTETVKDTCQTIESPSNGEKEMAEDKQLPFDPVVTPLSSRKMKWKDNEDGNKTTDSNHEMYSNCEVSFYPDTSSSSGGEFDDTITRMDKILAMANAEEEKNNVPEPGIQIVQAEISPLSTKGDKTCKDNYNFETGNSAKKQHLHLQPITLTHKVGRVSEDRKLKTIAVTPSDAQYSRPAEVKIPSGGQKINPRPQFKTPFPPQPSPLPRLKKLPITPNFLKSPVSNSRAAFQAKSSTPIRPQELPVSIGSLISSPVSTICSSPVVGIQKPLINSAGKNIVSPSGLVKKNYKKGATVINSPVANYIYSTPTPTRIQRMVKTADTKSDKIGTSKASGIPIPLSLPHKSGIPRKVSTSGSGFGFSKPPVAPMANILKESCQNKITNEVDEQDSKFAKPLKSVQYTGSDMIRERFVEYENALKAPNRISPQFVEAKTQRHLGIRDYMTNASIVQDESLNKAYIPARVKDARK